MPFDIEQWRADHFNDPYRPGRAAVALKVPRGSRVLDPDGGVAAEAWKLASDGLAENGTAYLFENDGWHWAAVVDGSESGTGGAYLLTIGPDGRQFAERYTSRDEAYSDLEHYTECAEPYAAPTPTDFGPFLAMTAPEAAAQLAPLARPVVVPDPVAVPSVPPLVVWPVPEWLSRPVVLPIPEPAPVALPPLTWQPAPPSAFSLPRVVAVATPEAGPVDGLELPPMPAERRGFRAWVRDQFVAVITPWLGTGPQLQRPRLVRLEAAA